MATTHMTSPVQPALDALNQLRGEIDRRVGKQGGHLNRLLLAQLATIESTLLQIEPLGNMINLVNQQTEVAVRGFRALAQVQRLLPRADDDGNGDDNENELKGQ